MSLDPVICRSCSLGPCKLGDTTRKCDNPGRPASVITVQDMVNYQIIEALKNADSDDND